MRNTPTARRGRQGRENVIQTPGGVKIESARSAKTALECFELYFTPEIVDIFTQIINKNIEWKFSKLPKTQQDKIKKSNKYSYMNSMEIKAYLGLLFLRGLFKQNQWQVEKLFDTKKGHPVFRSTMSYTRFLFISNNFCIDNHTTREARWRTDRFAAAR